MSEKDNNQQTPRHLAAFYAELHEKNEGRKVPVVTGHTTCLRALESAKRRDEWYNSFN